MTTNLLEANLNLAKSAAIFWSRRTSLDYDDCYQLASIGLFKASKTFEDGKGAKFQTWAHSHINNEIRNELRRTQRHSSEMLFIGSTNEDGEDTGTSIEDFGYEDEGFAQVEDRIVYGKVAEAIKAVLTDREWDILCKIAIDGVEQWKIAEMYGFQQPHVSRIMKGIRRKVQECQVCCIPSMG